MIYWEEGKESDGIRIHIYRKISDQKPQMRLHSVAEYQNELLNIILALEIESRQSSNMNVNLADTLFSKDK